MATGNPKSAAMYGIVRPNGHRDGAAWKVDLTRNGVHMTKSFAFSMFGGEAAALAQAQAWRDEIVREHPPESRRQKADRRRSDNTTGVPGVTCLRDSEGTPRGWVAKTNLSPKQILIKYFSVRRYGPEAKALAIAERQKQLEQMTGVTVIHPAEASVREAPPTRMRSDIPAPISRREIVGPKNQSGVAGVHRGKPVGKHPGYWVATTHEGNGRYLKRSFSVKIHGEEKAKEMAIAERQRQLEQVRSQADHT